MDVNLEDFKFYINKLQKQVDFTKQDIKNTNTLFITLKAANDNIANKLKNMAESFHRDITTENNHNELMLSYYQILGNNLMKVSQVHASFTNQLQCDILDQTAQLTQTIIDQNNENMAKINRLIVGIETATSNMQRLQDNYYKLSRNAEKLHEKFVKVIEEGGRTPEQLQKEQEKSMKMKIEAQEACDKLKKQITNLNQLWEIFYLEFKKTFENYDENEEQRLAFTRNSISQILKQLNNLYSQNMDKESSNPLIDVETKLKELEDKLYVKQNSFKLITKDELNEVLATKKMVEFTSYDMKKKMTDQFQIKTSESEDYTIISKTSDHDIQLLISYIKSLCVQDLDTINFDNTNNMISGLKKSQNDTHHLSKNINEKIDNIILNPANRRFLLNHLVKLRDLKNDSFEIRIKKNRYEHLVQLLKKLANNLYIELEWDGLYTILIISTKFYLISINEVKDYLYNYMKDIIQWQYLPLWVSIIRHIIQKKSSDDLDKKLKKSTSVIEEIPIGQAKIFSKLINFGKKQISVMLENNKPRSQNEYEICMSSLQEINYYIIKLVPNPELAVELIVNLGRKFAIEVKDIEDLIQFQKMEQQNALKTTLQVYPLVKKNKNLAKWDALFPIYNALPFLNMTDLLTILAVSNNWKNRFHKKIYRIIINRYGNTLTDKQRNALWLRILGLNKVMNVNFKKNLNEFLELIVTDKAIKHIEEVITIDVQRSFIQHKNFNSAQLQNLLRAYANYDKHTSYCQGMNYIMGFLLMKLGEDETALNCFCQIMEKYLKDMFDKEFYKLKILFYKFNKLIELHLPTLYSHFKEEKVDSSFFSPAWFITVFTNTFQNTSRSHFLCRIWDHFLIDGIKVIFQISLAILKIYEADLLDMKFDAILHFLGEIGKTEIFTNIKYYIQKEKNEIGAENNKDYEVIDSISKLLNEIILPNSIMQQLEREYILYEHKTDKALAKLKALSGSKQQSKQ